MKEIEQFEFPIEEIKNVKIPIVKLNRSSKNNEIFTNSLPKGKYDIHYVIKLLRIIHDKIESMKMSPRDIPFTMCDSMKRLIANLEVERDQNKKL